jgi:hypothetical protein
MAKLQSELKWVMEATTVKIMANRIGAISPRTREFILHCIMPRGLRDGIIEKYPGRMLPLWYK